MEAEETYVWFSPLGLRKKAPTQRATMTTRPMRRDHLVVQRRCVLA